MSAKILVLVPLTHYFDHTVIDTTAIVVVRIVSFAVQLSAKRQYHISILCICYHNINIFYQWENISIYLFTLLWINVNVSKILIYYMNTNRNIDNNFNITTAAALISLSLSLSLISFQINNKFCGLTKLFNLKPYYTRLFL